MIAGFTRGTQQEPLPLLPSGPGGVHGVPLREARLSYPSANSLLYLKQHKFTAIKSEGTKYHKEWGWASIKRDWYFVFASSSYRGSFVHRA